MESTYSESFQGIQAARESGAAAVPQEGGPVTAVYIIQMIESIIRDSEYIHKTIDAIIGMDIQPVQHAPEDPRPQALHGIVQAREETNRATLALLEKLYDGLGR